MNDWKEKLGAIRTNLTGDRQKDIAYLMEEANKHKDDPDSKELLQAITKLAYDALDDADKAKMDSIYHADHAPYLRQSQEIVKAYQQGKLDVAKKVCEDFFEATKDLIPLETETEIRQCFNEPLEQVIYFEVFKPTKSIVFCDIPYSQVYYYYGYILNDLDQAEKAKKAFERSRTWNQVAVAPIFELAEYYRFKDEEKFIELSRECLRYAYRKETVSRALRNIAFALIDQDEYDASLALFMMALAYQPEDQETMAEMHYLESKQGTSLRELSLEEIEHIASEKKYPIGPDSDLLEAIYRFGNDRYQAKDYRMADYFLSYYYDLTEDPYIKATLDEVRQQLGKR